MTGTAVKFYTCTQAVYDSATKIEGALYFTTDTKRLYKGSVLYGGTFEYSAGNLSGTGATGTLYYEATTGNIKVYEGGVWVTKFIPFSTTVDSNSTDATVATSKAVYTAVHAEEVQRAADDGVLSGAIDKLNGNASTAGSVAKAVKDASDAISGAIGNFDTNVGFDSTNTVKKYVDDINDALTGRVDSLEDTVAVISGSAETAGSFKAGDKAISGAIGGSFNSENTVADAIAAIENAAVSVSGAANNAIEVTGEVDKTVALKINANDKFLTQTSDGLSATISLVKADANAMVSGDVNSAEYYLVGKDGTTPIGARINIPKDQFLKGVEFVKGQGSKDDKLQFTFNVPSGEQVVDISLSGLFSEYEEGNGISLTATATGIKINGVIDNSSEGFLTVGSNGFKLAGVQSAIDAGNEALSAAIGDLDTNVGFDGDHTLKAYIDNIQTTLSGQIGSGFGTGAGAASGTVAEYINTKVGGLASSMATELNGKLDTVGTGNTSEIIIAKSDGQVEASGKQVGGSTIAAEPTANTVATEAAVSAFVDSKITAAELVWNTLS